MKSNCQWLIIICIYFPSNMSRNFSKVTLNSTTAFVSIYIDVLVPEESIWHRDCIPQFLSWYAVTYACSILLLLTSKSLYVAHEVRILNIFGVLRFTKFHSLRDQGDRFMMPRTKKWYYELRYSLNWYILVISAADIKPLNIAKY